ncbi:MAG: hypothetical protein AAFZ15_17775 [Bacteroidota bacterium]
MKYFIQISICLLYFSCSLVGQEIIFLKNASFEAVPKYATVPGGWRNCAFNGESPSDIHPVKNGLFQVNQPPKHGLTYVGLVTRDNSTKESIGQELLSPLKKGQCYELSLWLSRSEKLTAMHRGTRKMVNFNKPVTLRIWGGVSPCGRKFVLGETQLIDRLEWEKYTFRFQPDEQLSWICFEAVHSDENEVSYNGHILLDHVSAIVPIDCRSHWPLVDISQISPPSYQYVKHNVPERIHLETISLPHKEPRVLRDFRMAESPEKIDELIEENCGEIGFVNNSYELIDESAKGLMEIASNVRKFKNQKLMIGLLPTDQKLIKKRKKVIDRICNAIGLSRSRYEISVLPISENKNNWHCGEHDVWIKVAKSKGFN